jgi:polyhydroxyalkanoate synthesis regulator phasin
MVKKFLRILIAVVMVSVCVPIRPSFASSTEVDALIQLLVQKGIVSKDEARELKQEIASDEKLVQEDRLKATLPEWVQKTKLKGDFRLRYQYERKETNRDARERGRIRYRLGVESEVVDKTVKVGAGISSGADDPRSTNQSFTDTFERSDVRLDLAYAEYMPFHNKEVMLVGGVFPRKDYLWTPTDMLWDSDINPQGGSIHLEKELGRGFNGFMNSGVWVIDEVSSTTNDRPDPYMHYGQGGLGWKNDTLEAKAAAIYYGFNALKGTCPDWSAATNTGITSASSGSCTGSLSRDYDAFGSSVEFIVNNPFDLVEHVAFFGDYINNVYYKDIDNDTGWAAGLQFGDKKVLAKGKWQARYIFATLGKDAFVDFTPDSDRLGGRTDIRSHEGIFEVGLNKNISLALDYYYGRRMKTTADPEHLIQADFNFKF